jgi:hypothetical protein
MGLNRLLPTQAAEMAMVITIALPRWTQNRKSLFSLFFAVSALML